MFYRLILLFLLSISNVVWGVNTIAIIDDTNSSFNIGKSGFYFIDEKQDLSFNTIMSDEYAKRFRPINREYLQFGRVKGNVWIRTDIAIRSTMNIPVLLEIDSPRLQYLDIYLPNIYGSQVQAELGGARPYSNRQIQTPNYVFSIPANTPPIFTVYMKLSSHLPINANIELKTLSKMSIDAQKKFMLTGVLIGILLTIFVTNIFFYFKTSHAMYLVYAVLLAGIAMLHITLHDQASQFFPNTTGMQERIHNASALLCLCAITFFSRLYLDTKNHLPRMDKILISAGIISALSAIAFTLLPEILDVNLLSIIAFSILALLTVHSVIAFIKNVPFSSYFLVARLMLLTGYISWLMAAYGIFPSQLWIEWGLTLTVITEALIHFIGMFTQTIPLLQKRSHNTSYTKADIFDLLSDLSSRLRRQINIIGGGLAHLEQAATSPDTRSLLTSSQTANNNLKSLVERIDCLNDIKNNEPFEQSPPITLNQLIENAHNNFQRLDQDNTIIELNTFKTDHIEVLQHAKALQHLIEVLTQEFKHFTDQELTFNITYHELNRESASTLELNCYPLPARVHENITNVDFGMSYISLLTQHLKGNIQLSEHDQIRSVTINIPIDTQIRHITNKVAQQSHFDLIFFGQEDSDLQKALTILQSHSNKIEHFSTLESVLEHLENPEKRESGSIILVFDNGGHIPHITQQRILPLMRAEDQCLLISNNVKMSLDYAKKLGFDEILPCSDLGSQLAQRLSRLIQKGDRLKNTPLSRIKPLRKTP
ncbi:hypothetical protein MUS1_12110 [Marinomonas ushuaiensis DSM 15871]|uniref:7TM-DISM receptor extracellular domain-containing protein n=1 Tax=Marinomonas ushuaiensis DSM 15871 TaxID=1122207 RepID=X7E581_9GAMM|nr:7TM diverse intracellular signaling domain-containing protein [Marinomonas ushuaiensis]ETX11112.1 hypothetical protein MUS1_12110 [Marinomonas ushuaiensis DSM 15871]